MKNDYLVERQTIDKKFLIKIRKKLLKNLKPKNIFFPKDTSHLDNKKFKILYSKNRTLKFWKNFPKISLNEHKQGLNLWKKNVTILFLKIQKKFAQK